MGPVYKYSIDQLMELAGVSIAQSIYDFYEKDLKRQVFSKSPRILTICGPGSKIFF